MGSSDELVDSKLAELSKRAPDVGPWMEPSDLRQRARVRRIRHRGGLVVGIALVVVVLVATLVPIGLRNKTTTEADVRVGGRVGPAVHLVSATGSAQPVETNGASMATGRSEQQFSLSLLKQLSASGSSSTNTLISPSSLSIALSMLELGAQGDTQAQIAGALGSAEMNAQQQAEGWSALSAELAAAAAVGGIDIRSANSLWLQKGLAMDPSFMSSLSRYFASGVWQVDFASDPAGAVEALNAWVARETHGRITSLFGPDGITDRTALVLANAVYFKAAWEQPFDATTSNGPFHLSSGTTTSVPFMHSSLSEPLDVSAYAGSGVDEVQLPYQGGRMAALVIMPTSDSISDFSASLSQPVLAGLVADLAPATIDLTMPTLSLTASDTDLIPTLEDLGINSAFDAQSADFSAMSPVPLFVTAVAQKDTLDVTPRGTEATAATGIGMDPTAVRASTMSLTVDHPYLFLIRDTQTGAILFEAEVVNPTAG
jgi:serpin B